MRVHREPRQGAYTAAGSAEAIPGWRSGWERNAGAVRAAGDSQEGQLRVLTSGRARHVLGGVGDHAQIFTSQLPPACRRS